MNLFNSLTGKVEPFVPSREGEVRIYSCGPTVYKRPHIGNFRAFVMADLLCRSLSYLGYRVTQIMNITDVGHLTEDDVADARGEDRLQKEAERRDLDPWQIAAEEEKNFKEDLKVLAIRPADRYPRATDHVPEMIAMIEVLIDKGHAYEVNGNVYFDAGSFAHYGALSGNTLDRVEAGASGRVEERTDKRHPEDFALWKRDPKHLMQWDSPWGRGFPGWHIECSAMSRKYLGDTLDIHTGGLDNKFPHHECEIAQSESVTGETFVRHWVHCGWLEIGGAKMAKREGRAYTIPELVEMGYAGRDLRLFLIKKHYRAPLPFRLDLLDEARTIRSRLNNFVHHEMADRAEGSANLAVGEAIARARRDFRAALEDDINASEALAALQVFMTTANRLAPSRAEAAEVVAFMRETDQVLGVLDEASEVDSEDPEIAALLAEREKARRDRDFARADAIRDALHERGIEIFDTPEGPRWRRR